MYERPAGSAQSVHNDYCRLSVAVRQDPFLCHTLPSSHHRFMALARCTASVTPARPDERFLADADHVGIYQGYV